MSFSFTDEIFKIKAPSDALMYLCRLEGELQYALACQRLGLHQDRSEPTELTCLEDLFFCLGISFGWFKERLKYGEIPALSELSCRLLSDIENAGNELSDKLWDDKSFWQDFTEKGEKDSYADRAIYALECS